MHANRLFICNRKFMQWPHRGNKYWVPSEGLNDSSSGKCGIIDTGAKRVSERLLERKMRDNNTGAKRVSERLLERKMRDNNTGAKRVSERLLERKMRDNNTGAKQVSERLLERKMRDNNTT